jgi:LysM repeat protein
MSRIFVLSLLILSALSGCNLNQTAEPTPTLPTATTIVRLSCDALITEALNRANNTCSTLGRNQACYGNNQVQAELQPGATSPFAATGDIVGVESIRRLTTAPLDEANQLWGIAVLKVQANLPDTLPGQNVTFLLFGDAALDNVTPDMRAVVLKTGVGSTTCANAPKSALLLQSPEGTQATMTINGASITLGSTTYLTAEQNKELEIATIEGSAVVSSASITRIVQPGAKVSIALGGSDGLQVAGPPSEPEPFDAQIIAAAPVILLERPVQIPSPITPLPAATATNPVSAPTACVPRADWNYSYIVQAGETLLRIAQTFGVTLTDLQQANCLADPNQIQAGQVLRVPRQLATAQATSRPTNTPVPTPINPNLRAEKSPILSGECTTILWDTTGVSQVLFQGQPTISTNQRVCPTTDTTYTLLLVYQDGRQAPYTVKVQVILPTDAPIVTQEPIR